MNYTISLRERLTAPCAAHFTLQGKGGVGKSLVAAIVAQYFKSIGAAPTCIDTDPENQTLVNYKALNASHLPLLAENSSRVDERRFDDLMEQLLSGSATKPTSASRCSTSSDR